MRTIDDIKEEIQEIEADITDQYEAQLAEAKERWAQAQNEYYNILQMKTDDIEAKTADLVKELKEAKEAKEAEQNERVKKELNACIANSSSKLSPKMLEALEHAIRYSDVSTFYFKANTLNALVNRGLLRKIDDGMGGYIYTYVGI